MESNGARLNAVVPDSAPVKWPYVTFIVIMQNTAPVKVQSSQNMRIHKLWSFRPFVSSSLAVTPVLGFQIDTSGFWTWRMLFLRLVII